MFLIVTKNKVSGLSKTLEKKIPPTELHIIEPKGFLKYLEGDKVSDFLIIFLEQLNDSDLLKKLNKKLESNANIAPCKPLVVIAEPYEDYTRAIDYWQSESTYDEYYICTQDELENINFIKHLIDSAKKFRLLQQGDGFIGESVEIMKVKQIAKRVANSDIPVQIYGETGTGKEVIARFIHGASNHRSSHNFVTINCPSLQETLHQSSLFGNSAGFPDSRHPSRKGYLLEGDGGTIFLDELDKCPLYVQETLLSPLETRTWRPLGASQDKNSDFRIISASIPPQEDLVADHKLREDLHHRLKGLQIEVPPLRDRKGDLPLLIDYFNFKHGLIRNHPYLLCFQEDAYNLMLNYNWPGNVRELREVIRACLVKSKDEHEKPRPVQPEDLPKELLAFRQPTPQKTYSLPEKALNIPETSQPSDHIHPRDALISSIGTHKPRMLEVNSDHDIDRIKKVLKFSKGNLSEAARIFDTANYSGFKNSTSLRNRLGLNSSNDKLINWKLARWYHDEFRKNKPLPKWWNRTGNDSE